MERTLESRRGIEKFIEDQVGPILGTLALFALAAFGFQEWNRLQSNTITSDWSAKMRAKLQDPSRLDPEEKYYPSVRVVPAGRTFAELLEMRRNRIPVNVRNYPATVLPNGTESRVLGQISQGSEIFNVVLTPGVQANSPLSGRWGVFVCTDNTSIDWGEAGRPKSGTVCAIEDDYLASGQ